MSVTFTVSPIAYTTEELVDTSEVQWGYLIVGLITVAVSMVFYGYQFSCKIQKTQTNIPMEDITAFDSNEHDNDKHPGVKYSSVICYQVKKFVKMVDPDTCSAGERVYGAHIFFLLFCHFFMVVGVERIYGKFIRSYAIDKHKFEGDSATLLNTTFWVSFSLGRFAGFIVGRFIPIRILIVIEASGFLLSSLLLAIFARSSSTMLWVMTQPMSFFMAAMFPSGVAWGDYHLQFTGMAITFLLFGGGIGGMCHMWLIGYLYDNYSYDSFLYHTLGIGIAVTLFVTLLSIRSWGRGNRFKENEHKDGDTSDDECIR